MFASSSSYNNGQSRLLSVSLSISVLIGWIVAIAYQVRELCLVKACSDAATFVIFGISMGWFGVGYFSIILLLLFLRHRVSLLDWCFLIAVYIGVGAEFRLLWVQKYIIGSWCPFCVAICCALFVTAVLLVIEEKRKMKSRLNKKNSITGKVIVAATAMLAGFVTVFFAMKALY